MEASRQAQFFVPRCEHSNQTSRVSMAAVEIQRGEQLVEYSARSQSVQSFKAMEMMAAARLLEEQGRSIIHLEVGQPDFFAPHAVSDRAKSTIESNLTGYSNAEGLPELRESIAAFYGNRFGLAIDPRRVIVTAGASGALALLLPLLTDPGQGWLLPDPGYPSYRHFVSAFGCDVQTLPVDAAHQFQPTPSQIQEAWRSNTKACLLATPSNPAGTCIQSDVFGEIAGVVSDKRGHLIVDEIYQGVSPEGEPLPTMLSKTDDAFIVNSFSKYFGMTGWRLGWLIVPDQAVDPLIRIAQNLFICPSVVAQAAAVAAFREEAIEEADRRSLDLAQKRRLMSEGLEAIGFTVPANPDGAFYLFAEVPAGAPEAETFCHQALQQVGVAMTPGIDFGDNGTERFVRISCAQPTSVLLDALQRLRGLAA